MLAEQTESGGATGAAALDLDRAERGAGLEEEVDLGITPASVGELHPVVPAVTGRLKTSQ